MRSIIFPRSNRILSFKFIQKLCNLFPFRQQESIERFCHTITAYTFYIQRTFYAFDKSRTVLTIAVKSTQNKKLILQFQYFFQIFTFSCFIKCNKKLRIQISSSYNGLLGNQIQVRVLEKFQRKKDNTVTMPSRFLFRDISARAIKPCRSFGIGGADKFPARGYFPGRQPACCNIQHCSWLRVYRRKHGTLLPMP